MAKSLVLVESPAKCKTISKILSELPGSWNVMASMGHVRDLPKKKAVEVDNDFKMNYEIIERNRQQLERIIRAARDADVIYFASDGDREGSSIAWHIREIFREKDLLKGKVTHRIVFSEITRKAIHEAIAHPGDIPMNQVNAQQARRALDYLVGFNLSPVLWKKVHAGLSAGRVQSPALRMIADREAEIEAFKPQEYWTIHADLEKGARFPAKLVQYAGRKVEQFTFPTGGDADEAVSVLQKATQGKLTVGSVVGKERQRRPYPPFTTSTLQMDASRRLGFPTSKTMRVAQGLYEGVSVAGEQIGLITYMRTDAVNLAEDALNEIRSFIGKTFSAAHLPSGPIRYQSKSKNAQEAHEAIRPSSVFRTPQSLRAYLDNDQYKLYELIWKRAVACQMSPAQLHTVTVDFPVKETAGGESVFRSTGSTVVFPGFLSVYDEAKDKEDDEENRKLPVLKEGDVVAVEQLVPAQHFTEPPPRYSEASLVKTMEEHDIGRPSTYASIIKVLQDREYVKIEGKRFFVTDIGRAVSAFLCKHFPDYVDYEFTSRLENDLDAISRGEQNWIERLRAFWGPFKKLVDETSQNVQRDDAMGARLLGTDPKSGKPVSARIGRFGPIVQIGSKSDEEKPRFASIPEGKSMSTITFDEAMALFDDRSTLPRTLGKSASGDDIIANKGAYGPYLKEGKLYVNLKTDDPLTITLERALELIAEKKTYLAERFVHDFGNGLQVLKGKFGYYCTDSKVNANIPADVDPKTLTRQDVKDLLEKHGKRPMGKRNGKGFGKKGHKGASHDSERPVKVRTKNGREDDLPM